MKIVDRRTALAALRTVRASGYPTAAEWALVNAARQFARKEANIVAQEKQRTRHARKRRRG